MLASMPLLPNRALSQQATADPSTTPTLGQAINPSNGAQLELVRRLRERGALYYGAWWCPACFRQKNLFGQEAGNQLPYVECEKTAADLATGWQALKPRAGVRAETFEAPDQALAAAVAAADPADRIVVFGSFFTVGGVLQNGVPRLTAQHLA
jgi:hypothetical protein